MDRSLWYPTLEDVLAIHRDIVSEYPDTSAGVRSQGDIEFVLEYIWDGSVESGSADIHDTAFDLLRLLVANHPFVDGNKRTALNTVVVFYFLNGYRFSYDDEIRDILKLIGTDVAEIDEDAVRSYLESNTNQIELAGEIDRWREELIQYGIEQLTDDSLDPND